MIEPPAYFERIRSQASEDWGLLVGNPRLKGAWDQLFVLVQNPEHVVSELLQNADDAKAKEATVDIHNGEFIFAHDGEDFTEEQFGSLCRFADSNKRTLRTIGFRGIGFKSTFSLGDEVRVVTPTLSVAFRRDRFTEPIWVDCAGSGSGRTEIRVRITDDNRLSDLQRNLEQWQKNPASLLFCEHLRRLRIGEHEMVWSHWRSGTVQGSEWFRSSSLPDPVLLLRSPAEPFPEDALREILEIRKVGQDDAGTNLDCSVQIVLGMAGELYAVLPTGAKTNLPFACNAPFVQKPDREKIIAPQESPTNRWLLTRLGELAAKAMLAWLQRTDLDVKERCGGYQLFPPGGQANDGSLEGRCANLVRGAFERIIGQERFLLTDDGELRPARSCIAVPSKVFEIWSAEEASTLCSEDRKPILSRHVREEDRNRFCAWLIEVSKEEILTDLMNKSPPRPKTFRQLLNLWAYVSREVCTLSYSSRPYKTVHVVPVEGQDHLFRYYDVVRLGEERMLQSQDDWQFLLKYLCVVDRDWLDFLAAERRKAEESGNQRLSELVKQAENVRQELSLDGNTEFRRLIERVGQAVFLGEGYVRDDCVRLAKVAAKQEAAVPDSFCFVTFDNRLRLAKKHDVVADLEGDLAELTEEKWHASHALHPDYFAEFTSCSEEQWRKWAESDRSKLYTFVPLKQKSETFRAQDQLWERLESRGCRKKSTAQPAKSDFSLEDWDFDDIHWEHWRCLAMVDGQIWGRLLTRILKQRPGYWSKATAAKATYRKEPVTDEWIPPAWIFKFRELPCLKDSRGHYRRPSELMCRTPLTESLSDAASFVALELDTEATRDLLKRLGVRDEPPGPVDFLDRLRNLINASDFRIHEIEKCYRQLDERLADCDADELDRIKGAFANEKIVLTQQHRWERAPDVNIDGDAALPDAPVVLRSVRDLQLWKRLGIPERPSVEDIIMRLKMVRSGQRLSQEDVRRFESVLDRCAKRVWDECGHWRSLDDVWTPTGHLSYALADRSFPSDHLIGTIKQRTADLMSVPDEIRQQGAFGQLRQLEDAIEYKHNECGELTPSQARPWLTALGNALQRVALDDQEEVNRVHELGRQLAMTEWQVDSRLEAVPYLDGMVAGKPLPVHVLWCGAVLYSKHRSLAKIAEHVACELRRFFRRDNIVDAIQWCFERDAAFVQEYMEEKFHLQPAKTVESKPVADGIRQPDVPNCPCEAPRHDDALTASASESDSPSPTNPLHPLASPSGNQSSRVTASGRGSQSGSEVNPPRSVSDTNQRGAGGSPESPSDRGRPGYSVLRTIVVPSRPDASLSSDEDAQVRREAVDQAGIARVLEFERRNGREPREMPPKNPGYDVVSSNADGIIERYIEVKSLCRGWSGAEPALTHRQFHFALRYNAKCWLYVVEHAEQDDFQIHPIQDPARRVNRFMFDWGWKDLSERHDAPAGCLQPAPPDSENHIHSRRSSQASGLAHLEEFFDGVIPQTDGKAGSAADIAQRSGLEAADEDAETATNMVHELCDLEQGYLPAGVFRVRYSRSNLRDLYPPGSILDFRTLGDDEPLPPRGTIVLIRDPALSQQANGGLAIGEFRWDCRVELESERRFVLVTLRSRAANCSNVTFEVAHDEWAAFRPHAELCQPRTKGSTPCRE